MTNDEYEKSKTAKDPTVLQNVISHLCREMVKKDKEIENLEEKLEATQQLVAELVTISFNASCRCGDWQLLEQHEKDDIMKRIKDMEEDEDD